MPRPRLSLPNERRKVALKSAVMRHSVAIAEHRERKERARQELAAMSPPKKKPEVL